MSTATTTSFEPKRAVARELARQGIEPEWLWRGYEMLAEGRKAKCMVGNLGMAIHHVIGTALRNAVRVHAMEVGACVTDADLDDNMAEWVRLVVSEGIQP